jgi:hypothetical protein
LSWSFRGSFPRPQFNESAARSASLKVDTEGSEYEERHARSALELILGDDHVELLEPINTTTTKEES